jgi:transcriptional regulator with XRE-family HTH domain
MGDHQTEIPTRNIASPGERLRLQRERAGVTQDDLAGRVGVRQPFISQIERGKRPLSGPMARAVARALSVPLAKLDPALAARHPDTLSVARCSMPGMLVPLDPLSAELAQGFGWCGQPIDYFQLGALAHHLAVDGVAISIRTDLPPLE